ncbi:hypothetical protein [Ornithinimicrobium sp. INDO-MA30-4]|uniref:hypothetical protein n=1 Tax=Ornithinimicrobium sp. INDO-MA30-4 TaxID=2908651 RepID=UPI001F487377|nr:hypothetical protein [Ornithinimicrobium sp. INDO-MA30-4]UJH70277.1 hypothetical protein L0A91_14180 [Ornithinimicrobium sp. INDO-MA30-4]
MHVTIDCDAADVEVLQSVWLVADDNVGLASVRVRFDGGLKHLLKGIQGYLLVGAVVDALLTEIADIVVSDDAHASNLSFVELPAVGSTSTTLGISFIARSIDSSSGEVAS